ncbi:hypothetical protein COS21_03665 [bacterium (Candidatus Gribaldobacteria) CG02_land_8_20_14_3_00_41_15]|uniref:5'-deoxynucleotidase n=1 Tax=bacterium (Candidatus Gribaldobacteria) CG02_land_8_20_14_3_00_41_15 TaxID=2014270 RepID=A0A2M7DD21_9BACT|nr:MAG: hypothetical protein COS21_03665 [bacterium (Candidatus Gribaldobacteria) CG02_land_8_20_14_3_00_41_15]
MQVMNGNNLEKIFDFLHLVENLKSTLRYNFTKSGRKESSADHSWRLSLMLFILIKELKIAVDTEKSIKMALVHDLAKSITGDIDAVLVAEGKVSKQEKQKLELEAMTKIKAALPQEIGEEIYSLWKEYEDASTKEAKCVKAVDKLETLTQLAEAGYKTYDKPQFIANYADKAVGDFPELKEALAIIKRKLKDEFIKGGIPWEGKKNMIIKRQCAIFIPYRQSNGDVFVFLQKRSKTAQRIPDYFGFFGGGFEGEERAEQALSREIKEELNYCPAGYFLFGQFDLPRKEAWVFCQKVSDNFENEIEVLEGQYGKWFSKTEAMAEKMLIDEDKLILQDFFGKLTN